MHRFGIRRHFAAALALATVVFAAAPLPIDGGYAFAHATLVGSTPTQNAVLATPPHKISLRFNARIEGRVTQMSLRRGKGPDIPIKIQQSRRGNVLTVVVPPLAPGIYTLRYKVMATDSHITEDLIRFTVLKR